MVFNVIISGFWYMQNRKILIYVVFQISLWGGDDDKEPTCISKLPQVSLILRAQGCWFWHCSYEAVTDSSWECVFPSFYDRNYKKKNSLIKATRKRTLESPLCLHSLPNLSTTCWLFTFLPPPSVIYSNFYNIVPSASSSCLLNLN